jgi:hypothetical protein
MGIDLLQTIMCVEKRLQIRLDRDLFFDTTSLIGSRNPPDATVEEFQEMIRAQLPDNADVLTPVVTCLSMTTGIPKHEIKLNHFLFRDLGLDG